MQLPLLTPQFFAAVLEVQSGITPGLGVVYGLSEWRWAIAISDALASRSPNWAVYTPTHWSLGLAIADQVLGTNNSALYSPTELILAQAISPQIVPPVPVWQGITPILLATSSPPNILIGAMSVVTATAFVIGSVDFATLRVAVIANPAVALGTASGVQGSANAISPSSTPVLSSVVYAATGGVPSSPTGTTPMIAAIANQATSSASFLGLGSTPIAVAGASQATATSGTIGVGLSVLVSASSLSAVWSASQVATSNTSAVAAIASVANTLSTFAATSSTPLMTSTAVSAASVATQLKAVNTPVLPATVSGVGSTAAIALSGNTSALASAASSIDPGSTLIATSSTPVLATTASSIGSTAAIVATGSSPATSATASAGTGSTQDATVSTYQNNVVLAGGTVTSATLGYLDTFVKGCKTDGFWTLLSDIGVFCGSNLAAALVKLKFPATYPASFTNTNFIEADYSQATGLNPGSSGTRRLNAGVPPTAIAGTQSFHLSYYSRSASNGTFIEMQSTDGTNFAGLWIGYYATGVLTPYFDAFDETTNGELTASTVASTQAFFLGSRTAVSNVFMTRNGVTIGTAAVGSGTKPAPNLTLFSQPAGGTTDRICAYYSMGGGLTVAQGSSYYTRVQALQTSLGRQV